MSNLRPIRPLCLVFLLVHSASTHIYSQTPSGTKPPCKPFDKEEQHSEGSKPPGERKGSNLGERLQNLIYSQQSERVGDILKVHPTVINDYQTQVWNGFEKHLLIITATQPYNPAASFNVDDANASAIESAFAKFGYRHIKSLEGSHANYRAIADEIGGFIPRDRDKDLLVIYFIAHGSRQGNDFAIDLVGAPLTMTSLIAIIREKYKGKTLIILDSCNSGKALNNSVSNFNQHDISILSATKFDADDPEAEQSASLMKNKKASVFTYYFLKAISEDWNIIDLGRDGLITLDEVVRYLSKRFECSFSKNEVSIHMTPDYLDHLRGPIFFDASKVQNLSTPPWQQFFDDSLAELLNTRLRVIYGNPLLIRNAESNARVRLKFENELKLIEELEVPIRKLGTVSSLTEAHTRNHFQLIARNKTKDAIQLLESSETQKGEDYYLTLGMAQRYIGNLTQATSTYDAGLKLFPESVKIRLEEASTLVFSAGDTLNKNSISVFLEGVELELKTHRFIRNDTAATIESFRSQLTFLKRLGDLEMFDQRLKALKEQYTNPTK